FGRSLEPQYRFDKAKVVVSFDADFTSEMPNSVRFAHDFARRRRLDQPEASMSRLYIAETTWSPTGSLADHRLSVRPSQLPSICAALLGELARLTGSGELPVSLTGQLPKPEQTAWPEWVRAAARDLHRFRGESVVIAGDQQPFELHLLAHALNKLSGSWGKTIALTESALLLPEGGDSLHSLVNAIRGKEVDSVAILEANPVYTAPPELELARALAQVKHTLCLAEFDNETTQVCNWVVPAAHYLETWGDARSYDGTISFLQPLLRPLHASHSLPRVLAGLAGIAEPSGLQLLRGVYERQLMADFSTEWRERLKRGFAPGSAFPTVSPAPDWGAAVLPIQALLSAPP